MKKFIIFFLGTFTIIFLIIRADILDRMMIRINGLSNYKMEEYESSYTECEDIIISVDMNQYTGNEIIIYEKNALEVIITDIKYRGDEYRVHITSSGEGYYENGKIISLEKVPLTYIDSSKGRLAMELIGMDSFEGNEQKYIFSLYPVDEITMEELSKVEVEIRFSNMEIIEYVRK